MTNKIIKTIRYIVYLMLFVIPVQGVYAHHTDTHFDEETQHKIVYQLNKADPEYINHILFSAGEMLRKYGDNIEIVIAAFGPGMNLFGKRPVRPISPEAQQRVRSLASYGVQLHACGNTMKSLGWSKDDILEQAKVVPIGVDDVMQLQEQGYSYISW